MRITYEKRRVRGLETAPPTLRVELQGYWAAWQRLRHDRQYGGMSGVPLGIPFAALDRYAERYGYESMDAFEDFSAVVRTLDDAFLAWWHEKNKPPEGPKP